MSDARTSQQTSDGEGSNSRQDQEGGGSSTLRQQDEQNQAVHYHIQGGSGVLHFTTSEHAAQQIALLQAEIERLRKEVERKDSTIFNFRFRSYLEGLGEAERQATGAPARGGTTGLLKAFFDKALIKAIANPSHPLHAIQNHYRKTSESASQPSLQVKQKADDLFPHFSRNIHKYFESGDDFELPRNLDMHDALLAELLAALKPTTARDGDGRVDASIERARFI